MARMNVVVCVKQIPDPAEPGKLEADNTLDRSGKLILDESDSYGVEMALQLVDAAGGGEVTLVSMAPNNETSGLRTALAMGAAKAILVSDDALSGAGALDTAKVLAAAIKRAEPDLVLAATESSDGYTGTVPEQVAALLGLTSVTFAKHVEIDGEAVKVQRQTELGYDEVEATLPALVSVTAGVVEPRYPCFKGIMAAKSKPVDQLTAGRPRHRRRHGRLGRRRPGDRGRRRCAGPRGRRDRRGRRRGLRQDRRLPREPQGHLSSPPGRTGERTDMALNRIWVYAEAADGKVAPITLEMLTKARDAGRHRRGRLRRRRRRRRRRGPRRPRRHQGVRHR